MMRTGDGGNRWFWLGSGILVVGLLSATLATGYFFRMFTHASEDLGATRVPIAPRPAHDVPVPLPQRAFHHRTFEYAVPSPRPLRREETPQQAPTAVATTSAPPRPGPNAGDLTQ